MPLLPRSEDEIVATWRSPHAPPLVSVICATYNHAAFIGAALQGILGQVTDFAFELIVRDDASSDGTGEVLRSFATRYPKIVRPIIESENTYSKGLKPAAVTYPLARGQYIALCDGDDYWLDPNKLQRQRDFLRDRCDFVACHHAALDVDESGNVLRAAQANSSPKVASREAMMRGIPFANSSLFFRNCIDVFPVEFFRVVNGDTFLISLLGQHGKAGSLVDLAPVVYRHHRGGVASMKSRREQLICNSVTALWLSHYYCRLSGAEGVSDQQLVLAAVNLSNLVALPWTGRLALAFPDWYRLYASLEERLLAWKR